MNKIIIFSQTTFLISGHLDVSAISKVARIAATLNPKPSMDGSGQPTETKWRQQIKSPMVGLSTHGPKLVIKKLGNRITLNSI